MCVCVSEREREGRERERERERETHCLQRHNLSKVLFVLEQQVIEFPQNSRALLQGTMKYGC